VEHVAALTDSSARQLVHLQLVDLVLVDELQVGVAGR
jgi:hypothetical protein